MLLRRSGFGNLKRDSLIMKFNSMKCLLLIIGLSFFTSVNAQSTVDSNYVFSGYTERLAGFKKMPVSKSAVIFLGNSLTDAGRWKDIAPELPILNRGISGDISYGVYARLDEIVRHHPRKIFLMIGVNDLKRGIPTQNIINNYERIVEKIHRESPKTKIYLNSILPVNNKKLIEAFKAVKNEDIQVLNAALNSIGSRHSYTQFVDLYPIIAKDGELMEELTPDGIHLEVDAYVKVVEYLKSIKVL